MFKRQLRHIKTKFYLHFQLNLPTVLKEGLFKYENGCLFLEGWEFDGRNKPFIAPYDYFASALRHIEKQNETRKKEAFKSKPSVKYIEANKDDLIKDIKAGGVSANKVYLLDSPLTQDDLTDESIL